MNGTLKQVVLAGCLIMAAGLACRKPKPMQPSQPVPAGSVLLQFTKKVDGPVELTVDGVRVPVAKTGKKCKHLSITGLAAGKHHLVLLGALNAFGPDEVDVELGAGRGEFRLLFAQQFKSELYGKPEPIPAAEGIPGVKATLLP